MKKLLLSVSTMIMAASNVHANDISFDTSSIMNAFLKNAHQSSFVVQQKNTIESFELLKMKVIEQILEEIFALTQKKNTLDQHLRLNTRGDVSILSGLTSQSQRKASEYIASSNRVYEEDDKAVPSGLSYGDTPHSFKSGQNRVEMEEAEAKSYSHPLFHEETTREGRSPAMNVMPIETHHAPEAQFSYPSGAVIQNLLRFCVSADGTHFTVDGERFITDEGKKEALAKIGEKLKKLKELKKASQEAYYNSLYVDQDTEEYQKLKGLCNALEDQVDALEIEIRDDVIELDEQTTRAELAKKYLEEEYGEEYEELETRAKASRTGAVEIDIEEQAGRKHRHSRAKSSGQSVETDKIIRKLRHCFDEEEDVALVDFDELMRSLQMDETTEGQLRVDPTSPKSMVRGIYDWLTEETAADSPEAQYMVKDLDKEERDAVLLELSKIKGQFSFEDKFKDESKSIQKIGQESKAAIIVRDNTRKFIDQRSLDWETVKGFNDAKELDGYIAQEQGNYGNIAVDFNDIFAERRYDWLNKELENHPSIKEKVKNKQLQLRAFAEQALQEMMEQYYAASPEERGILRLNPAYRLMAFDLGGDKPAHNPTINLDETPDYVAKIPIADADFSDTITDHMTPKECLALWGRMNKEGLDRENSGFPKRTIFYKNLSGRVGDYFEDERDQFDVEVSLRPSKKFEATHAPLKPLQLSKISAAKAGLMTQALKNRADLSLRMVRASYKDLDQKEKALLRSPSGTLYNTAHLILVGEYDAGSDDFDDMFSSDRVKLRDLTSDELIAFRYFLEDNFIKKEGMARAKLNKCYQEVKKIVDAMFVDSSNKEEATITLKPKTFKEEEPFRRARLLRATIAKKEDFIHGLHQKAAEFELELRATLVNAPEVWFEDLLKIKAYDFMLNDSDVKVGQLQAMIKGLNNKEKIIFFSHAVNRFGEEVFKKTKLRAEMEALFKDGADKFDPRFVLDLKKPDALNGEFFQAHPLPKVVQEDVVVVKRGGPPPPPPPGKMPPPVFGKGQASGGGKDELLSALRGNNKRGLKSTGLVEKEAEELRRFNARKVELEVPENLTLTDVLEVIKERVLKSLQLKKTREEVQDLMDQWGNTYSENRTQATSSKNEVLEARLKRFKIMQSLCEGDEVFQTSKEAGLLNDELVKLDQIISLGAKSRLAGQEIAYAEAMKPLREKMAAQLLLFADDAVIKDAPKAGLAMARDLAYLSFLKMNPSDIKKHGLALKDLSPPKESLAKAALANALRGIHFELETARSKAETITSDARSFEEQYMAQMNMVYRNNLAKTLLVFDGLFKNQTRSPVANQKIELMQKAKIILDTKRSSQITDEILQDVDLVNLPYFVISALYGHVKSQTTYVDESTEARINFMDALESTYYQLALPEVVKDIEKEMEEAGEFDKFTRALETQKKRCASAIKRAEDEMERKKKGVTNTKSDDNVGLVRGEKKAQPKFVLKKPTMPLDLEADLKRMSQGFGGFKKKEKGVVPTSSSGRSAPPPPPGPMPILSLPSSSNVEAKEEKALGGNAALLAQIAGGFKLRKVTVPKQKERTKEEEAF